MKAEHPGRGLLTFLSDFGRREATVSQMYGVALGVDPTLNIQEVTHEIRPFDIREASYRLFQAILSWPSGTVFVAVVDPGVGSERRSVAAHTPQDHYIVGPDNGILTHVVERIGLREVREIDEKVNRLPNSQDHHTFHGRDVYGYTGACLASGKLDFTGIGSPVDMNTLILLPQPKPQITNQGVEGIVEIHDLAFGNVWTNIPRSLFDEAGIHYGDRLRVLIEHQGQKFYEETILYDRTFFTVPIGSKLLYNNEVSYISLAENQGNVVENYKLGFGRNWKFIVEKLK